MRGSGEEPSSSAPRRQRPRFDARTERPLPSSRREKRPPRRTRAAVRGGASPRRSPSAEARRSREPPQEPAPPRREPGAGRRARPRGPDDEPGRGRAPGARAELRAPRLRRRASAPRAGRRRRAPRQFFPSVTPIYQRSDDRTVCGIDFAQRLPWTGGTLDRDRTLPDPAYGGSARSRDHGPAARCSPSRCCAASGRTPTFYDLTNARRRCRTRSAASTLARQRLAVDVAAAFYAVIAQRQLLERGAPEPRAHRGLLKSSEARLEVGLASKLDVFRAELQAAQASDAMVRSRGRARRGPRALPRPPRAARRRPRWSPRRRAARRREDDFEPVEVLVPALSRTASSSPRRATRWATRGGRPRSPGRTSCPRSTSTSA